MRTTREKLPAWQQTKVRYKKDVIEEARKEGKIVQVPSLMDMCHLKNSELEPKFQKYKGRVVLRGDTVEDVSGSYAVFTEKGSSASQMTAAKVMGVIARRCPQSMSITGGGEGPEPACVQTLPLLGWHTQEEKGELTSCRGTV